MAFEGKKIKPHFYQRAKKRDAESQQKLHELEEELVSLKAEFYDPATTKLEQEKSVLQAEKERYKLECNKLRKDLAGQISLLKTKLEHAEQKLNEKCSRTKRHVETVFNILDGISEGWDEDSETGRQLLQAKEILQRVQKSMSGEFGAAVGCNRKASEKMVAAVGIQTENEFSDGTFFARWDPLLERS